MEKYFPAATLHIYISPTSTSALEAFHGHHHQMIGKTKYLYMYEERTHMHNLMWNAARVDDLLMRFPGTHIPAGILRGDDWIRASQAAHHVLILAQPTFKAAQKKARQIARKRAKLEKKQNRDRVTR